ncbi:MAG: smalltalk protein [Bacteroidaceae bacterium]|nr:smalltalk protein [Bacteroidaceae bacterium]
MNNEQDNKNGTWEIILRIIIAVASALAGALGMSACVG